MAQEDLDLHHGSWSVGFACVGGTDPMNHKKASSLSILQMRDICCQLSWSGYKFCHFSLELKTIKRKDCVIKVLHVPMQLLLTDSSPPPARHME